MNTEETLVGEEERIAHMIQSDVWKCRGQGTVFTGRRVAHNRSGLGSFEHHGNTNNSGILSRYILAHDTITKSWNWKDLEVSCLQRQLPDACGFPVSQEPGWVTPGV